MASTIRDALAHAGLVSPVQTMTPDPQERARRARAGLPKWLTREGLRNGPMTDFVEPLSTGSHKVWLIGEQGYSQVVDARVEGTFILVWLDAEVDPRKFRAERKVRYALTPAEQGDKAPTAGRAASQQRKRDKARRDAELRAQMKGAVMSDPIGLSDCCGAPLRWLDCDEHGPECDTVICTGCGR